MTLSFFDQINFNLIFFNVLITSVASALYIYLSIQNKKVKYLSLISIVLTTVAYIIFNELLFVTIITLALNVVILVFNIIYHIYKSRTTYLCKEKITDFVKNSEFDYFLTIDNRFRIVDSSNNILNLLSISKKDLNTYRFPDIFNDNLNIKSINNLPATLEAFNEFRKQVYEANSKVKSYSFFFIAMNSRGEEVRYEGMIQPVYFKNKLIGKNIYVKVDKLALLERIRASLQHALADLKFSREANYILMSLSSGVVMYFDNLSKKYIATESLKEYTNTTVSEYNFEEFLKLIHPEDEEFYFEQSRTINTHTTTRIKYRLKFNDKYYKVIEDSIYIDSDEKLVSIIRIVNQSEDEIESTQVLSTKEKDDLISDLSSIDIDNVLKEALDETTKSL